MREASWLQAGRRRWAALVSALVVAVAVAVAGPARAAGPAQCPWMDSSKSSDERASELVHAMSLDDEIAMLYDGDPVIFAHYGAAGYIAGNPSLCIPDLVFADGASGVAQEELGTTAYPAGIAKAASFDPSLERDFGRALGWEAWHKGVDVMLSPAVNIVRVAQNGRNGEYFGEDPFLAARSAVATTEGIQSNPVIATVKHYALNNQETNQNTINAVADERTIREIYMPAFEAAVRQAHAGSVMCSANLVNGAHSCANPWLLNDVLKGEWGMPGFVMSDWGATHSTMDALDGLDMEMGDSSLPATPATAATPDGTVGTPPYFGAPLKAAVESGKVPRSRIADMVFRIARTMFDKGIFDHPPAPEPQAFATDTQTPDNVALALKLSEDGTVLLKNAGGLLPLAGSGQKIAVLGPAAGPHGTALAYSSGGSPHVPTFGVPLGLVSPAQGIERQAVAQGDTVLYADGTATQDAVAAAKAADVAVVFVYDAEEEAYDRPDLHLHTGACPFPLPCFETGPDEDALISAVAQANPNTIVVIDSGGPVVMPWLDQVKGVLEAWYPGQEDGDAIASILYGEVNPSAKLPITFPASVADLPTQTPQQYPGVSDAQGNPQESYSERLLVGYRWYDAKGIAPLFPFGFGLSYTSFRFSGVSVSSTSTGAVVRFTLQNTGSRFGADVAQVYVGMPAAVGEPPRQLKGFAKVWLDPGQAKTVSIPLGPSSFAHWDTSRHEWIVTAGTYQLYVGDSSRNLPLQASLHRSAAQLGQ
jgi:beta-glucosidase